MRDWLKEVMLALIGGGTVYHFTGIRDLAIVSLVIIYYSRMDVRGGRE